MTEDVANTDKKDQSTDAKDKSLGGLGVVMPPTDILAEPEDDYQETDVFAWANNLIEYKEDLALELFWINKNNVVYRTKTDPSLANQMQPLFIDNTIEQVLDGPRTAWWCAITTTARPRRVCCNASAGKRWKNCAR